MSIKEITTFNYNYKVLVEELFRWYNSIVVYAVLIKLGLKLSIIHIKNS